MADANHARLHQDRRLSVWDLAARHVACFLTLLATLVSLACVAAIAMT